MKSVLKSKKLIKKQSKLIIKTNYIKDLTVNCEVSTNFKSQDIENLRNGTIIKKDEIIKDFINKFEKLGFMRNHDF